MTALLAGIAITEKLRAPMIMREDADISIAAGILGDARGAKRGRQVTVLFLPDWADACAELDADLPWITRRANLLVDHMNAPRRCRIQLRIGEVVLEVTQEMAPCEVMERAHKGLKAALTPDWRGGVCCAVILGGRVAVGDPVTLLGQDDGRAAS